MNTSSSSVGTGQIFLVGAGPGDPGLLTLRGLECLKKAECVLYDYLVNPAVLDYCSPQANKICLGQHRRANVWTQQAINQRMVDLAKAGQTVVRLKGGDPAIFSRMADEIDALVRAGIPFEVVPGITASLAAASYAGIPLTHRDHASAVAVVTGQEQDGKDTSELDFEALARFPGTLVMYMGVTTAHKWSTALMDAGKPPDTPVAIVRRCSRADQETITCKLQAVTGELSNHNVRPPAIVIIGNVVQARTTMAWFEKRPLFGQRVLVTRPIGQTRRMCEQLSELGAMVLMQPAVQVGPPENWSKVDEALARLSDFDWIVFSSANGVRTFFERLFSRGYDLRALATVKFATIGPATTEELARYHLTSDRQPAEFRAESLAEALTSDARDKRFLLVQASRGREVLAEELQASDAIVTRIVTYSSVDVTEANDDIQSQLDLGQIDWVTVTSSAIARSLVAMFGEKLRKTKLVSLSPVTSQTLRELGHSPTAEATTYTMEGLVSALVTSIT